MPNIAHKNIFNKDGKSVYGKMTFKCLKPSKLVLSIDNDNANGS